MDLRTTIKVYGLVQGVFFRQSVQEQAKKLGLSGYIKNEPDKCVLIIAEGKNENLEKLINWCKVGPDLARIEKIEVKWEKGTGEFKNFVIRY